jgi:hypothetical protein
MVKQKLLDTARDIMRRKHLSYRTEEGYICLMGKSIDGHIWTAEISGID